MPTTKSAKKRLRQSLERRARNRAVKSNLKTQLRKVREAIAAKDVATSEAEYRVLVKKLDQAASNNVLHFNTASRLKSRLSARCKSIKPPRAPKA